MKEAMSLVMMMLVNVTGSETSLYLPYQSKGRDENRASGSQFPVSI